MESVLAQCNGDHQFTNIGVHHADGSNLAKKLGFHHAGVTSLGKKLGLAESIDLKQSLFEVRIQRVECPAGAIHGASDDEVDAVYTRGLTSAIDNDN